MPRWFENPIRKGGKPRENPHKNHENKEKLHEHRRKPVENP
jgi:hypothetical protein